MQRLPVDNILVQMDESARNYLFPMPDNVAHYNAGMRLTAFRSDDERLVIFEMINYVKGREFINELYAYGDRISAPGLVQTSGYPLLTQQEDYPFWNDKGEFVLPLNDFTINVKGSLCHIKPAPAYWQEAGIREDSSAPPAAKMLRLLMHLLGDSMYELDSTLLKLCGRENRDLSVFMQLNAWYHPRLAEDEMPSESISLRTLAEALQRNDLSCYQCPVDRVNSHWSHAHWNEIDRE